MVCHSSLPWKHQLEMPTACGKDDHTNSTGCACISLCDLPPTHPEMAHKTTYNHVPETVTVVSTANYNYLLYMMYTITFFNFLKFL